MDDKTTFCIEIELLKYCNRILNEFRTIWAKIVNFKKKIEEVLKEYFRLFHLFIDVAAYHLFVHKKFFLLDSVMK